MSRVMTSDENIIYQLQTLASYEADDLDNPEFEVAYEALEGAESFASVCCVDLASRILKLIEDKAPELLK